MKTNPTTHLFAAATVVLATSAFAQEAEKPVAVKTDGLPDYLKTRIEERARQGYGALRRYLQSTSHIHNVRIESIVKRDDDSANIAKKEEPRKVADRAEAGK
jgi:hypothetical protein